MRRAQVLDWGLQEQLWPHMEALRPRPSVYIPEFIAANQSTRADNLIPGTRAQQVWHAPPPAPLHNCFSPSTYSHCRLPLPLPPVPHMPLYCPHTPILRVPLCMWRAE